jgi:F0F1-type ATP synthase epsilon subunit
VQDHRPAPREARLPREIDVARAEKARQRAEGCLHHPAPDTDIDRACAALARALARLQAASKAAR